jgi:hypothetical protein
LTCMAAVSLSLSSPTGVEPLFMKVYPRLLRSLRWQGGRLDPQ